MPSPFPGMNPYLEQDVIWHDFHERFLPAAAAQLTAQLLPRYIVLIDENVYLHDLSSEDTIRAGRLVLSASVWRVRCEQAAGTGLLEAAAQALLPEFDAESES